MTRVLSVSSSRADVGILAPVWSALEARDDIELHVFLTGMHRAKGASPVEGIPTGATVHEGGADLGGTNGCRAADAMASITSAAADTYAETLPDVVLIVGDRLDMLPAAVASLPFNIPLVHLHGGEVTEGAVDDRIRHALTKFAHLHCVSSERAKGRLLAMGEPDNRITVTGAPGLDTLLAAPVQSKQEFARQVGLPVDSEFRLVTVHPETNADDMLAPVHTVLEALTRRPALVLITAPNSDPYGAEARALIDFFVAEHEWAVFVDTLGSELYPNALRQAALMIGNSSSGIIEAGMFGLPVIDVGDRQTGRERGANVVHAPNDADAVIGALDRFGPRPDRFLAGTPYGSGDSGPKVAAVAADMAAQGRGPSKRVAERGVDE